MYRFVSRQVSFVLVVASILALPQQASAGERPHRSAGTAQFVGPGEFVGSGRATHLGNYEEVGIAVFSPTSDPTVLQVDASATYTTSNGDQLNAIFVGELDGLTGVISATVTYVGGTGRFANATGTANLTGQIGSGGTISVTVIGTIDY